MGESKANFGPDRSIEEDRTSLYPHFKRLAERYGPRHDEIQNTTEGRLQFLGALRSTLDDAFKRGYEFSDSLIYFGHLLNAARTIPEDTYVAKEGYTLGVNGEELPPSEGLPMLIAAEFTRTMSNVMRKRPGFAELAAQSVVHDGTRASAIETHSTLPPGIEGEAFFVKNTTTSPVPVDGDDDPNILPMSSRQAGEPVPQADAALVDLHAQSTAADTVTARQLQGMMEMHQRAHDRVAADGADQTVAQQATAPAPVVNTDPYQFPVYTHTTGAPYTTFAMQGNVVPAAAPPSIVIVSPSPAAPTPAPGAVPAAAAAAAAVPAGHAPGAHAPHAAHGHGHAAHHADHGHHHGPTFPFKAPTYKGTGRIPKSMRKTMEIFGLAPRGGEKDHGNEEKGGHDAKHAA